MNVQQMHIEVLQRLQEVGSYKRDKFRPEEIDLALNKATYRLLETGVENEFQGTQVNLSHVAALIYKNKISEVIQPQTSDVLYEQGVPNAYSVIPSDHYWLVNGRVEVIVDPLNCETAPSLAKTNYTEYVAVVPFPELGSTPYFTNTTVFSSTLGSLYTSPTPISTGFNSPNAKFVVVGNILETLYRRDPNLQVYWERYRDEYYQNSFIFVGTVDVGTITLTSSGQSSIVASAANVYQIYNRALIPALPSKTVSVTPVRVNREDMLYPALQNSFYKTRPTRPVVDQTFDYFIIYTDISFIITRFYYDYIRKPRTISLVLGQDCELAPTIHPKIIDFAVELLKLDTKDQSYPATVQDVQLRSN